MLDASAHFFRLLFSPASLFPGESLFFFFPFFFFFFFRLNRHLKIPVDTSSPELLITASLRAACPIPVCPSSFSLCLSRSHPRSSMYFFRFPASNFGVRTRLRTYVRMYGSCNRRIPRARLLGTNETRPFALRRPASRRVGRSVGRGRAVGTGGFTGLHRHGSAAHTTLEHGVLRDSMKLLLPETAEARLPGRREGSD